MRQDNCTVVLPVHNGITHLMGCLRSLAAHTELSAPVIVIDDASSDRRIPPYLHRFAHGRPNFTLHRNSANVGYSQTINRGFELAGDSDVAILNSDTLVTPGWLGKLRLVLHSRPDAATVTPVSNSAGAFSVPIRGKSNPLPRGYTVDAMAQLVESASPRLTPEVPTGNGFCMLIRRATIDDVGPFDSASFPSGYGSENDFCARASAAGYVHLIDDSTFIYHHLGGSFGWRRPILRWRADRTLRRLHPSYCAEVARWLQNDPIDCLRARLTSALELSDNRGHVATSDRL